ncbi:MAG: hypothetical protein HQK71_00900 [Desulfamplus sp.]|nr:hypothetical protein [Desulfamplus sp.]
MMDNKKAVAQVIDFQKTMFDNSYAMISNIQDQSEQIMSKVIDKNPLIPNDTLKVCTYWVDMIKKNRKNYKSYVDTNFMKIKDMFKLNETADDVAGIKKS